ncbi:c-type cytochrome [Nitratiruptor tergarcus]|uniref:Cytochrome c553 n=1 Tax=Nitratiruptor tergarcus DSM 16512 TaxID=1069081 RepID=A0A1W1WST0_9BACT|nr:c-type cytochrome [Nitratiruptor tergarcus]SMC09252.1 Cytochrome c553 [Nitratiruptor tergarcus DSM 16512]
MKKALLLSITAIYLLAQDSNVTQGEQLYTKNGCYGCHGSKAEGANSFPKLAGKSESYIIKRLHGYKNGTIHSNRADMMTPFAKALNENEIKAIAQYIHSLGKKKLFDEERYFQDYEIGTSSGS